MFVVGMGHIIKLVLFEAQHKENMKNKEDSTDIKTRMKINIVRGL